MGNGCIKISSRSLCLILQIMLFILSNRALLSCRKAAFNGFLRPSARELARATQFIGSDHSWTPRDLMTLIKKRDSEGVLQLYREMKCAGFQFKGSIFLSILSVCHKVEHLPDATDLFNDMIAANIPPTEQSYLALIRCHSDDGQVEKATALVKHMITIGIEPKLRTYQPILEAFCYQLGDLKSALDLIRHMYGQGVFPRSEQLSLLLETCGRNPAHLSDAQIKILVDEMIKNCSVDILGLNRHDMMRVVASINQETEEESRKSGVLLESVETIQTAESIIVDANAHLGELWTLNIVPSGIPGEFRENFISISESETPPDDCTIAYQQEKYRVLDMEGLEGLMNRTIALDESEPARMALVEDKGTLKVSQALKVLISSDIDLEERADEISQLRVARGYRSPVRHEMRSKTARRLQGRGGISSAGSRAMKKGLEYPSKKAEVVEISNDSCRCPNCGDYLQSMFLTDEESHRVRVALMKIASTNSIQQCKNLQDFAGWLEMQEEFVYIVDGANVAYNRQNFDHGKFSYRQIELVVNKLQEEHPGDRILVVLPYPYAQKVVPNSVQHGNRRRLTYLNDEELSVLDRLQQDNMLYITPQGSDDDWYWMFCTVSEGRKRPSYVVTNDLMRDHKLAFLEPRPFFRWRSNQVLHFEFSRGATDDAPNPETFLITPEKFPREIHRTTNQRWHIPCTDNRAWLCVSTEPYKT